jgi:peptidoglycan hydrolase CwlO-like protein
MGILATISKLFSKSSLTDEEIRELLKNHETRIAELEKKIEDVSNELESQAADLARQVKDVSSRTQSAKKQTTKELQEVQKDLDRLLGAIEIVINGELAPERMREIRKLKTTAKRHSTRITNVITARLN